MILNKQDCIESITQSLERTAAWRRDLVVKFPDDIRNARAAETLEKLAIDAADLTDEQWAELSPRFGGWASQAWRQSVSFAARQVGFAHRQKSFDSFVKNLIGALSLTGVAA
jgi:hypothetical protein